jgi:PAS domain S-box-containing protein
MLEVEALKRLVPGFVAMNPATAVSLLLAAGALAAQRAVTRRRIFAFAVIAIAGAKLIQLGAALPGGVDQLLFASELQGADGGKPNRMAPNTATALLCLGAALVAGTGRHRQMAIASQILAAAAATIAFFALVGYLLGVAPLYGVERFIPMALHTAISLLVLAVGVFSSHPRRGLMRILRDPGPAGSMARVMLPLAVVIPVAVGLLRLSGQRAGLYGTETGVALQVLANVLVTFFLLLGMIIALYRSDFLRRQREISVARSEEQYRLAERIASVGHWRMELPSKALSWSDEIFTIAGLDKESGVPSADEVLELYHPEDRERARAGLIQAMKTGESWDFVVRLLRPGGEVRSVRSHGVVDRNDDGRATAVFGVFADVTDLEKARHAAEAATAEKAAFLANMSHEIRTPLNAVIGFTDLLLEEESFQPAQRRQLELIQNSGAALLNVVNDVLDFSKIEAGKVELEHEPFALVTFVDNTVSIVQGAAEAKGLEVRVSLDPVLAGYHCGDEARLRQVLLNLLNNAVKFTASGSVSLEVSCAGQTEEMERIRFSVTDTGLGVPEEKQHRLFQQFSQADATVSREYGGTGLGLAICKKLVGIMAGEIGYTSAPGGGSTFWFEVDLPVSEKPVEIVQVSAIPEKSRRATILLAEDLPMNQELACAILERAGHKVDVAADGAQAVKAVQEKSYDLVLMDIQMPKVDGLTATKMIRGLESPVSRIPILAMTANVLPEQVKEFMKAGMDGHVAKPIKQVDLHRAIERVLTGREIGAPEGPSKSGAEEGGNVFDREIYGKIAQLFPKERLTTHLASFQKQVRETAEGPAEPERLKSSAHKLISQAGMLGFMELSDRSRDLEEACEGEGPLDSALDRFRRSAERALAVVQTLSE